MTLIHCCVDVRGILNWKRRDFARYAGSFTTEDGTRATPDQVRDFMMDELSKGHEVIPMTTEPCVGFDYVKGCPGHEVAP